MVTKFRRTVTKNKNFLRVFYCLLLTLVIYGAKVTFVHATAYRTVIQSESTLLDYWPMDEASGATSLTPLVGGTSINLTGATTGTSGQVDGNAVTFNGTSNYGVTASNLDFSSRNKLVVEALLYVSSYNNSTRVSWELSPSTITNPGGLYFAQDVGSNVNSPTLKGNAGFNNAEYTRPTAGQWHLFTMVYNMGLSSNEVDEYIDGTLQTSTNKPFNVDNTGNFGNFAFYLMSRGGTSFYSAGKMQHLAIYSDLSASRIAAHAQAAGLVNFTAGTLSESTHTSSTATLGWTSGTQANGSVTTQLQRSAHSVNSWSNVSGATSSPATDTGLGAATTYDYRVMYTDSTPTIVYSNTVSITTNKIYPTNTANSDTVIVGPYDTARSGTGNWNPGGAGSVEWLVDGHQYRIRQPGTISRIRIYTASTTNITGFYFEVWRKNGTTYDLVGKSNNISTSLVNAGFATIDLSTSVTGVRAGDFYGARMETSGSTNGFYAYSPGSVSSRFMANQAVAATTGMDWASKTLSNTVVPIEMYMSPAPQAVFIGDSIIQGVPNNYSFLDPTNTTNLAVSMEGNFSSLTGYTYQNMGHGSDTTNNITARFTNDLINLHPKVAIMEGGVNDIYGGSITKSQFLANWTSNLNAAQASSSITKILVFKILPWTNGTTVQNQTRDDWNVSLVSLASTYSKVTIVDALSVVGQFRAGGDAGNLWDIQPAYSADGIHYTPSGYAQIAQVVANSLDVNPPVTTDNTDTSWHSSPVTTTLTCTDSEGSCATTYYTTDGSTPTTSSSQGNSVVLSTDGTYTIKYFSVDNIGNQESVKTASHTVLIDSTPPTITNVSSDKANGSYKAGEVIDIDVTFSESVSSSGNVTVTLETGATDRTCIFTVSGATTGTCNYTVQPGDTSSDLTVNSIAGTLTDVATNPMTNFSPATNLAANKALVIDTTAPTISAITPVSTPTSDSTPDYIFTTNEAGTISYGGSCSSATTSASSGSNTVTFNTLSDGTYTNCTITVTDTATNASNALTVASFTVDATSPTATLSPLDNATDVSPTTNLVLNFSEAVTTNSGNITIKKTSDNSTAETIAVTSGQVTGSGTATITINPSVTLADQTEYYVQIASTAFRDHVLLNYAGIGSTTAWSFTTSDTTAPTISAVTPVSTPTSDNTPSYVFTTNEAGTISYGGSCSSATTSATSGSNTVTFNTLSDGTYTNCTITVTDAAANTSNELSVASFTVDTTAPTATLAPVDNATGVSPSANLVLTFSEAVTVNTGSVTIKKTSDNSTIETINVTSGQITGSGSATITINPSVTLQDQVEYYVLVSSTAFRDHVLLSYAGISSTTAWSFTVTDSTAPTIASISSDKANGSYKAGEVIDIDVTFSEAVTSSGNVTVTLETGASNRSCTFTVSSASSGTCDYTVQSGDTSADLTVSSIAGTIADNSSNPMTNFTPATNLAANKALVIDTIAPTTPDTPLTTSDTTGPTPVWSWTASSDMGSGVATYLVQWSQDSGFSTGVDSSATSTNSFTHTSDLTDGTWYFRVRATDAAGNASGYSSPGEITITLPVTATTPETASSTESKKTTTNPSVVPETASTQTDPDQGSGNEILLNDFSDFSSGTGHQLEMSALQEIHFTAKSELHSLQVTEIGADYVIILIHSDPITARLNLGMTGQYDVDKDGTKDISVKLISIANGVAKLEFAEIKPSSQSKTATADSSVGSKSSSKLVIPAIVVVLVILSMLTYRKVKRRHNSQDIV